MGLTDGRRQQGIPPRPCTLILTRIWIVRLRNAASSAGLMLALVAAAGGHPQRLLPPAGTGAMLRRADTAGSREPPPAQSGRNSSPVARQRAPRGRAAGRPLQRCTMSPIPSFGLYRSLTRGERQQLPPGNAAGTSLIGRRRARSYRPEGLWPNLAPSFAPRRADTADCGTAARQCAEPDSGLWKRTGTCPRGSPAEISNTQ